jgi:hypothetical protein
MEGATEQLAVANEKITTLENEMTAVVGQLEEAKEAILNAELSLKEEATVSESSVPTAEVCISRHVYIDIHYVCSIFFSDEIYIYICIRNKYTYLFI